jgi:hypothetical protein
MAQDTTSVERIGAGNPDGMVIGWQSTDKISFFGAVPVVRPAVVAPLTGASDQSANAVAVNALITGLQNLGLFANA